MGSGILSSVLCVFCVLMLPAVWADNCNSYWDMNNDYHEVQECNHYCCGNCNNRYCCSYKKDSLTQEKQDLCPGSTNDTSINIGLIVGSILGSLILVVCVTLIICCVAPCCLCYKKCRKRHNQRETAGMTTVNTPQPAVSPIGHQVPYPGYQSVPVYDGPPMSSASPPSYLESINPAHSTAAFSQGQPMHISQPSPEPHAEPPHLDELIQPPYNPAYVPNP